jgi:hypothetical protein
VKKYHPKYRQEEGRRQNADNHQCDEMPKIIGLIIGRSENDPNDPEVVTISTMREGSAGGRSFVIGLLSD